MTQTAAPCPVVLLAGPSGSGKSHLVRVTGACQLRLDDFYRDHDAPGLPTVDGLVDWDDPRTWDAAAAADALEALLGAGRATVPLYSIAHSRAEGTREVVRAPGQVVVAEGIFAPELLAACRDRGLDVHPVWLERSTLATFARRLRRDFSQHRKPPLVLVRRGLRLARTERALRRDVLGRGFVPMGMRQAVALVTRLQG